MEDEYSESANIRDAADGDSSVGAVSLCAAALAVTRWRRAQSDASKKTAGASRCGCACARNGGIVAGRSGGSVVVVGHGRGVEDGVAGPWAAGEAGWLGEACGSDAAAAATFGGIMCW